MPQAEPIHEKSLSPSRERGDRSRVAVWLRYLAWVSPARGSGDRAREALGEAAFAGAEAAGRALPYDDVTAEARMWLEGGA